MLLVATQRHSPTVGATFVNPLLVMIRSRMGPLNAIALDRTSFLIKMRPAPQTKEISQTLLSEPDMDGQSNYRFASKLTFPFATAQAWGYVLAFSLSPCCWGHSCLPPPWLPASPSLLMPGGSASLFSPFSRWLIRQPYARPLSPHCAPAKIQISATATEVILCTATADSLKSRNIFFGPDKAGVTE